MLGVRLTMLNLLRIGMDRMALPPGPKVPSGLRSVFGRNLRAAREAAGLTQEQLADTAQITRVYVTQIEGGLRNVSLDVAVELAKAVHRPLSALLPNAPKSRKK